MHSSIAIIADEFTLGSAAQQLLDHFLFQEGQVIACCPAGKFLLKREHDGRLKVTNDASAALASASNVIIVNRPTMRSIAWIGDVFRFVTSHHRVFVYGALEREKCAANCVSGSVHSVMLHVPELWLSPPARIKNALFVGNLESIDALLAVLDREPLKLKSAHTLQGQQVWDAQDRDWSSRLLAAAFSRADKVQGNTLLDGRTEDMVGLGLVPKFAKNPRAHIFEFTNNSRAVVMEVEGAVADLLLAVETDSSLTRRAKIYSTQLHQGATPQREEFSRLAATIIDFFQTGRAPWPARRSALRADMLASIGA